MENVNFVCHGNFGWRSWKMSSLFESASVHPHDNRLSIREVSAEGLQSIRFSASPAQEDVELVDPSKLDLEYTVNFTDQPSGTPLSGVDRLLDQQTTDRVKLIINCLIECDTELSEEHFFFKISLLGEQCHRLRQRVVDGIWKDYDDCGC